MSAGFREVDAREALVLLAAGHRVVDVREREEWEAGHIPGATLLPLSELPSRVGELSSTSDAPLLLHCAVGARSRRAAAWLAERGYTNVASLGASLEAWRAEGGPWEAPADALTDAQRQRYARQMLIPEVGADGQRRLLDARVLLIGAGGLGSPVALYLAAAGVGTMGLVDDDLVEDSNLQRQVLHTSERIGMPKVASAALTLRGLNPELEVIEHRERLTAANADRLLAGYDLVVDGTDNLETRYVLNDAALRLGTPVVHGSIYRWEGQVTTFVPHEGPCYRCLHPEPPPPELAPACEVAGVMGVLPGLVGMLQATEALKLILAAGEPLVGRLLMVDALGTRFEVMRVPRDPACPACGTGFAAEASARATQPAPA